MAGALHAFREIPAPASFADLRMLIGMFGIYQTWLQNYEVCVSPLRKLQSLQPKPGLVSISDEAELLSAHWDNSCQELLSELKEEILSGPVLARPDPNRRFYIKTDWSRLGMGAVLLQADGSPESREAEARERAGGRCEFERSRTRLRLRPIAFISRRTTKAEQDYHSLVGEASVGRWSFGKWKKWLLGAEFTWLCDCSGLSKFFETDYGPTHQMQRWRAELSMYACKWEHRPADLLTNCDMLSRYNLQTEAWRKTEAERQHQIDRQEQENDPEPVELAQVFNASSAPKVYLQPLTAFLTYAFPAELIEPSGSRFPLPPTRATGLAKLKQSSTNAKDQLDPYPQDRKRVVLAIDAAGAPVIPALFLTGLTAEITEVSSTTAPLTTPFSQSLDKFMDKLLTDPSSPCVA